MIPQMERLIATCEDLEQLKEWAREYSRNYFDPLHHMGWRQGAIARDRLRVLARVKELGYPKVAGTLDDEHKKRGVLHDLEARNDGWLSTLMRRRDEDGY